jgi:IS30 family transposase
MSYTRLTAHEREEIALGFAAERTYEAIAADLGRSKSTIWREARRGGGWQQYRAHQGQAAAEYQARTAHRRPQLLPAQPPLLALVQQGLKRRWSPQQIQHWLRQEHPTLPPVSHETIYRYLYALPRGALRRELIAHLRQGRLLRRAKHQTPDGRGQIADRTPLAERPAEVEDRAVPGHWEGDLILGAGNRSAIGTLVERSSRLVLLVHLPKKDAVSVAAAFARRLRALPATLCKTLTYDQGKEMARHLDFTIATGMKVYFCDPHSPWQRGTNENTNGLIRDFFPKGTDFSTISHQQLSFVQQALNERPRKTLDWKTPKQVFANLIQADLQVALAT